MTLKLALWKKGYLEIILPDIGKTHNFQAMLRVDGRHSIQKSRRRSLCEPFKVLKCNHNMAIVAILIFVYSGVPNQHS